MTKCNGMDYREIYCLVLDTLEQDLLLEVPKEKINLQILPSDKFEKEFGRDLRGRVVYKFDNGYENYQHNVGIVYNSNPEDILETISHEIGHVIQLEGNEKLKENIMPLDFECQAIEAKMRDEIDKINSIMKTLNKDEIYPQFYPRELGWPYIHNFTNDVRNVMVELERARLHPKDPFPKEYKILDDSITHLWKLKSKHLSIFTELENVYKSCGKLMEGFAATVASKVLEMYSEKFDPDYWKERYTPKDVLFLGITKHYRDGIKMFRGMDLEEKKYIAMNAGSDAELEEII